MKKSTRPIYHPPSPLRIYGFGTGGYPSAFQHIGIHQNTSSEYAFLYKLANTLVPTTEYNVTKGWAYIDIRFDTYREKKTQLDGIRNTLKKIATNQDWRFQTRSNEHDCPETFDCRIWIRKIWCPAKKE